MANPVKVIGCESILLFVRANSLFSGAFAVRFREGKSFW